MVTPIYNLSPPLAEERGPSGSKTSLGLHCFRPASTTSKAPGNVAQFVESLPRVHDVLGSFPSTLKSTNDACNPSTWRQENQKCRVIVYYVVSLRSTGDTLNACHKIDDWVKKNSKKQNKRFFAQNKYDGLKQTNKKGRCGTKQ